MIDNAMLVTTCPDCRTTFRITTDILEQADGQVRCGQCRKTFDGILGLSALDDNALQPDQDSQARPEDSAPAEKPPSDESPNQPAPERKPDNADDPTWLGHSLDGPRRTWPWTVAAGIAALLLCVQLVHQFRAEIAGLPAVGAIVASAYSALGQDVFATVDLDQYDLTDLTAAAQPFGSEEGWLVIETRVVNDGPKVQPYPHVFVRLLDRWDATVAGRYFGPEEYAVAAVSDFSRMTAGTTVDAQFIVMDPGPNATGFELELCTPLAKSYLCESDLAAE